MAVNLKKFKRVLILSLLLVGTWTLYNIFLAPSPEFMVGDAAGECHLPDIDPFDKSISKYVFHIKPLKCRIKSDLTFIDKDGLVKINTTACLESGFDPNTMKCSYEGVYRIKDDDNVALKTSVPISMPGEVPYDFFLITCRDAKGRAYTNLHAHVSKKTFSKTLRKDPTEQCSSNPYNLLIFGLDSISRLNGIRKLPKTYGYLTKNLGAYDFRGYTKVGANTFPNILPILTGKYSHQLQKTPPYKDFYDGYPLIWKNFSRCGYVSLFAEDAPHMATFNYLDKGFHEQPTDHYMRPFWLSFKNTHPIKDLLSPIWLALESQKVSVGKAFDLCVGSSTKHQVVIKYFMSFVRRYYGKFPMFALSWLTEIGHEYLNTVEAGDEDFYQMLKTLHDEGFLNNSFLFFMSDHGHRFDWFRQTLIGRIEDKMPLVLLKIPDQFKTKYPGIAANFMANTQRLVSPFDTHETIKDVLQGNFRSREEAAKQPGPSSEMRTNTLKAYSFFSRVPKRRTCAQAGIPEEYCACYKSAVVNLDEKVTSSIANFVLQNTITLTDQWRDKCAKYELLSVKYVQKREPMGRLRLKSQPTFWGFSWTPEEPVSLYIIAIEVNPGQAVFETTISMRSDNNMEILGEISRINRYGNQSHCMSKREMRPYCFCL